MNVVKLEFKCYLCREFKPCNAYLIEGNNQMCCEVCIEWYKLKKEGEF